MMINPPFTTLQTIHTLLLTHVSSDQNKAKMFFKTSPGSYSENDQFLGVKVPVLRKIAKSLSHLSLEELKELLYSPFNEERLLSLFILVDKYQQADLVTRDAIAKFYIDNLTQVNNWNLVDSSAHLILGPYLENKNRQLLKDYALSNNLWYRRVSILSTLHFIRQHDLVTTFEIAQLLLSDPHDLIHKAVGWMLREAGKRNEDQLLDFLERNYKYMPKTMFRYSIAKLDHGLISKIIA